MEINSDEINALSESFIRTLLQDVILAVERHDGIDTPANRRNLIRTLFAAAEGMAWHYREHVKSTVSQLGNISAMAELALTESNFSVTKSGRIIPQTRYFAMESMFRLVTRLAEDHCPGLKIDFDSQGWSDFQTAINIRNRLTHPKSKADLDITQSDIDTSRAGFFWLLETCLSVMEALTVEFREFTINLRAFGLALQSGDADAVGLYKRAMFE